jgi:hypothetical protein
LGHATLDVAACATPRTDNLVTAQQQREKQTPAFFVANVGVGSAGFAMQRSAAGGIVSVADRRVDPIRDGHSRRRRCRYLTAAAYGDAFDRIGCRRAPAEAGARKYT